MTLSLMLSYAGGLLLGVTLALLYFGGLWLTVRALPRSRHPSRLLLVSFSGRLALVLVGLYAVVGLGLDVLAACFAAFLVTRFVLLRRVRRGEGPLPLASPAS